MAWTRFRILWIASVGVGLACGEASTPPSPYVPPLLGDAGIERQDCGVPSDTTAFRQLASMAWTVVEGPCGELAWTEGATGAVYALGRDGEPRKVADRGRPLWIRGQRLLLADREDVTLLDDGGSVWSWPLEGAFDQGPRSVEQVPGAEVFWFCDASGDDLVRIDESGVTSLAPDFLESEEASASHCLDIDASKTGHIVYPTEDHRVGIVEVASGARRLLDHPFHPLGTRDEQDRRRSDEVRIAPDGAFVLLERIRSDEEGLRREGILLLSADGPPLSLPGSISRRSIVYPQSPRLWMGSGPGVFLPGGSRGEAHLVGLGEPLPLSHTEPRALRGDHLFVEEGRGFGLLELATGALHHLQSALGVVQVVPFRWGGPVVFAYQACRRRAQGHCAESRWRLASWTVEHGPKVLLEDPLPPRIEAVGPEGSSLLARYSAQAEPGSGGTIEPDPGLFLHGPSGEHIRTLGAGVEQVIVDALGGEHFALFVRELGEGAERRQELVAVDWAKGEEKVLVSGKAIDHWSLDHADRG